MSGSEKSSKSPGLKDRFFHALRSKPSRNRLTKNGPGFQATVASSSPLEAHRQKYKERGIALDSQLGERRDDTALLHGLTHRDSFEYTNNEQHLPQEMRRPGERMIASLPPRIWELILDNLTLADAANLAFSSKTLLRLVGIQAWTVLKAAENHQARTDFLLSMDCYLPNHLFCFPCAIYHVRTQRGEERLKPKQVLNPLYNCPNAYARHPLSPPPTRLTPRRTLPFPFLQLAIRAHKYTPDYGIRLDSLSRRWKEEAWSHATRFATHNGHLLLRVTSTCFAAPALPPSGLRLLLYSREDYTPYFSVCAHWRNGLLMDLCKCALGHIPEPPNEGGLKAIGLKIHDRINGAAHNPNAIVTLCGKCRSMRRCPQCPTEYLIEIKLSEDKDERSFRQAIVITRWSDLGDERKPWGAEWAACNGVFEGYDSFGMIGKRAIAGMFEAGFTDDHIPGQRILSLNPKGEIRGEDDNGWY